MSSIIKLPADLIEQLPKPDPMPRIWIVGGAIRDHLLSRDYVDIDVAVDGDAIALARAIADVWEWHFFILDGERDAARILPTDKGTDIHRIDFARLRGEDINEDLEHRDFTINALALDPFDMETIIDPTGGLRDLKSKQLRACRSDSLQADPVRTIRAVRFATDYGLKLEPDTIIQIRMAAQKLDHVSIERTRDELFQILNNRMLNASVRLLDHLEILKAIFPQFDQLKSSTNGSKDASDRWDLTLSRLREVEALMLILQREHDAEAAADAVMGSVALRLGRFRQDLDEYLNEKLSDSRTMRSLLAFTLLLYEFRRSEDLVEQGHSTGAGSFPVTVQSDNHIAGFAQGLRLSRVEAGYIQKAVDALENLEEMAAGGEIPLVQIYRYYRVFETSGVGAVILFLANTLAQSTGPPDADLWQGHLDVARTIWEAYFEHYNELVDPAPLLDGTELMAELNLEPGPEIGELLRGLLEAQVSGDVTDRAGAISYARQQLRAM